MAFSLTPRDLDWLTAAPVRYTGSAVVAADPTATFALLADHVGWASWYQGITKVVPDGAADVVGATRTVHLGPVKVGEQFVAWEPGARFAFTGTSSTAPGLKSLLEDLRLSPAGEGRTTVEYTFAVQGAGPAFLNRGLQAAAKRLVGTGLQGLQKKLG